MARGRTRTPDDYRRQARMFQNAIPQAATEPAQKEIGKKMISELKEGAVIGTFLVNKLQTRQTGKGKDYWCLDLSDKSGTIEARMWDIPDGVAVKPDDFIRIIKGEATHYPPPSGPLQITVRELAIVPDADVNLDDFLATSAIPPAEMYATLCDRVNGMRDEVLKNICTKVVTLLKPQLLRSPAGVKNHHAFIGGLLEHILSLWDAATCICLHPGYNLNLSLLQTACLVHDIGKTMELSARKSLQYTTIGKLVGHVQLGSQFVDSIMGQLKTPMPIRMQVLHMIASHHGELEWGAATKPQMREAVVFHYLDQIDAKLGGIDRAFRDNASSDEFVYVPILRGEVMR